MMHMKEYRSMKKAGDKWQRILNTIDGQIRNEKNLTEKEFTCSSRIRGQGHGNFCYAFAGMNMIESIYHLIEPAKPVPSICEDYFFTTLMNNHVDELQVMPGDFIEQHINAKPLPLIKDNMAVTKGHSLAVKFKKIEITTHIVNNKSTIQNADFVKSTLLKYGPLAMAFTINRDQFITYHAQEGEIYSIPLHKGRHAMHIMTCLGWKQINGIECLILRNSHGAEFGCNGNLYLPTTDLKNKAMLPLADITYVESIAIGRCVSPAREVKVEIGPSGVTDEQILNFRLNR